MGLSTVIIRAIVGNIMNLHLRKRLTLSNCQQTGRNKRFPADSATWSDFLNLTERLKRSNLQNWGLFASQDPWQLRKVANAYNRFAR